MYKYNALITRVIDGDTFEATVDLGFYVFVKLTLRLQEINTPETWRPETEAERYHGELATKFVSDLILNKNVIIESTGLGIYGRWNAIVYLQDNQKLSNLLESSNLSKLDNDFYKDIGDDYEEKINDYVQI